jgi:hypothetical protein
LKISSQSVDEKAGDHADEAISGGRTRYGRAENHVCLLCFHFFRVGGEITANDFQIKRQQNSVFIINLIQTHNVISSVSKGSENGLFLIKI